MEKTKLMEYLAAQSYKYDQQLTKRKLDPNRLRNEWYNLFPSVDIEAETYETITEDDPLFKTAYSLGIHDKKFIVYNSGREDGDQYNSLEIFNIVWTDDEYFYITSVKKCTPPRHADMPVFYYRDQSLYNFGVGDSTEIINFVKIVNEECNWTKSYNAGAIVYVCEVYGYEPVINYIKNFS